MVCALDGRIPDATADSYGDEVRLLGTAAHEEAHAVTTPKIGMGSLDKEDIDKVVKRRLAAIRYCYEKELTHLQSLAGKVSVSFTIDASGRVSQASIKESTLGNGTVENCILRTFERMRFPSPVGGGIVTVTYPFVFKAG